MSSKPFGYQKKKQGLSLAKRLTYLAAFLVFAVILSMGITLYVADQLGFEVLSLRQPFSWMLWAIYYPEYKDFFRMVWLDSLLVLGSLPPSLRFLCTSPKSPPLTHLSGDGEICRAK
ncbi:hypothetical protein [Vibrio parahaemolyticus]|uniref:hypothetical protein n=1 Tax=Vibrio parahaemolyticus TaxID=670 RepID=UPI0023589D75|nr:hypothetical protein [Vibrio parahaemolyticus]WCZ04717.1 hypothetical protein GSS61_26800 [Vibrio parahaemolyticus]